MTLAAPSTSVLKSHASAGAASPSAAAASPAGAADAFAALLQGLCSDALDPGAVTLATGPGAAAGADAAAGDAATEDPAATDPAADPLLAVRTDLTQAAAPAPNLPPHLVAAAPADASRNLPGLAALLQAAQAHEQRPGRHAGTEGSSGKDGGEAIAPGPARAGAGKAAAGAGAPEAALEPAAGVPATPHPAGNAFAAVLAQHEAGSERATARESTANALDTTATLLAPAVPLHDAAVAQAAIASPVPPLHQAALTSHPLDAAFGGDLAAEVKVMVDGGVQQAELHLNPADLGPIRIQLSLNAQTADISFAAAHSLTREGLAQALPALRDLLAQQGLNLGQAGVSGGAGGDSAFQAPQREAKTPRGEAARQGGTTGAVGAAPVATTLHVRAGRGMLDLYA